MIIKIILLIALSFSMFGCKSKGDAACEGVACASKVQKPRNTILKVDLLDTHFYDINSRQLIRLEKIRMDSGDVGLIPIYSHLLNKPIADIMDGMVQAESLVNGGSLLPTVVASEYNPIPYFKIRIKSNETYQFQYIRQIGSTIVAGTSGVVEIRHGGYAYLPLVNEVFGGQLSSLLVAGANSSDYTHTIKITPTSPDAVESEIKTFKFRLRLNFPLKDFVADISDELRDFNLRNRWQYYYNLNDGIANTDMPVATISDGQDVPDSQSADLKIVFRDDPVLSISQTLFDEEVVSLSTLKSTGEVSAVRGERFIEKIINLDSAQHFQLKLGVNNNMVTLDSNREVVVRNIPADTKWTLSFHASFTPNVSYPPARALLKPLAPMCHRIHGSGSFLPLTTIAAREAKLDEGGYYSVCHPDTSRTEIVEPENISAPPVSLKDTWFDFFSYMPTEMVYDLDNLLIRKQGHFYGVKEIKFAISGCFRVYSREASALPTNPNAWELKSEDHDICGTSEGQGWSYFNIEKATSISEFREDFGSLLDLQILINSLTNKTPVNRSDFFMNGDTGANLERFY